MEELGCVVYATNVRENSSKKLTYGLNFTLVPMLICPFDIDRGGTTRCAFLQLMSTDTMMQGLMPGQVSSWLIQASKESNTLKQDRKWLDGDAITMIVAGRYLFRLLWTSWSISTETPQ